MALTVDSVKMLLTEILPPLRYMDDLLAIIGILYLSKISLSTIWDILVGLRAHFWSRLWKKNLVEQYGGNWAVVTGCTDGIGKAYAIELAKNGMDIVLISRSMDKLVAVEKEIVDLFDVKTEKIQTDFLDGKSIYRNIEERLKDKQIGILVNNVGMMLSHPKYFESITDIEMWGHINVNISSVVCMTKIILPGMLSRGKGAIVNLASIAATGPIPLMSVYSASKAFVDYFSQALQWENVRRGLTIQTVTPAYVSTNMTSFNDLVHKPSFLIPTASTFAKSALSTLGYTHRTTGYWSHGIQCWLVNNFMTKWMWIFTMKMTQIFLMPKNSKKE